jgi:hypothetical protein
MTNRAPTADRVAALPDDQATTTLLLVLRRQGMTVDPFTQAEREAHLREALNQPEITQAIQPEQGTTRGDLARTALTHLAQHNDTRKLIDHALDITPSPDRDPTLLLATGALVLLAFRADIDLAHEPGQGWKFRFHTKGLSDSVIAKLLSQLLGHFLNPPPNP